MLVRGDRLSKTMSAYLIQRIEQHPLIDVHLETQLTELHPDGDKLAGVTFTDAGRQGRDAPVDARLPLPRRSAAHRAGARAKHVLTDAAGYILTGQDLLAERQPPRLLAARPRSAPARDQPRRALRRGRRAARLDEARRRGRRGGLDGRALVFTRLAELGVTV